MIEIQPVDKDTELAAKLLHFVEECSWDDCKDHIAGMIRDWVFTDWETMFAAVCDDAIVGMASIIYL